jgi:hypothetical protein
MSVSKEDREAYQKGVEDSKENPLVQVISGVLDGMSLGLGSGSSRSESEEAAYQKGLRGEQLDENE